jgi:hypothetical protein
MDASSAVTAGVSLYQAGGFALLILAIFVVFVGLILWYLRGMIRELGNELRDVRNEMQRTLVGVVKENTRSNYEVRDEVAKQTVIIAQQNAAMHARPCLQESGTHPVVRTPLPRLGGM